MNELEQYSIQKIAITGEDGTFNNRYEIGKNPAISSRGYSSDFGLDLRGVNATKEVFVNIYVKAYKYTVTYMDDGQPCEDPTSYFADDTVAVKKPLTKNGYTFKGWQADSDNANLVIEDGKFTMPARDVVFTAVWQKADCPYTVKFYRDSVSEDNYISDADTNGSAAFGTTLSALNVNTTIAGTVKIYAQKCLQSSAE